MNLRHHYTGRPAAGHGQPQPGRARSIMGGQQMRPAMAMAGWPSLRVVAADNWTRAKTAMYVLNSQH